MDTRRFTTYERVGDAFIDSYYLRDAGSIENFRTAIGRIVEASQGGATACSDGTPAPNGLHVWVEFEDGRNSARMFTDPDEIIDFTKAYGVHQAKELEGRRIKAYFANSVTFGPMVGLEPLLNDAKDILN